MDSSHIYQTADINQVQNISQILYKRLLSKFWKHNFWPNVWNILSIMMYCEDLSQVEMKLLNFKNHSSRLNHFNLKKQLLYLASLCNVRLTLPDPSVPLTIHKKLLASVPRFYCGIQKLWIYVWAYHCVVSLMQEADLCKYTAAYCVTTYQERYSHSPVLWEGSLTDLQIITIFRLF